MYIAYTFKYDKKTTAKSIFPYAQAQGTCISHLDPFYTAA